MELKLINPELLNDYRQAVSTNLFNLFDSLEENKISTDTFSFYTSISAIASSKIEGETLEIDSYIKHKMLHIEYLNDLVEKPNDLYAAYLFAQKNELTLAHFLESHRLLSEHLLESKKRGVCRTGNMVIMEHKTFRIQYEAALATEVKSLFALLWEDIELLIAKNLSREETFFYAAYIHLVFVNIHPFEDGNGRAARLLEKWFLAQKLGEKSWFIQSELYYYEHVNDYYKNLNRLGLFYDQLDYSKALPFLLMLPNSLSIDRKY